MVSGSDWIIEMHPENVGCAGAWNRILELAPDAAWHIISNDDIAFRPRTVLCKGAFEGID